MAAYLITHSLLSSWLHLIRENPYEDLTTEGDPLAEFMLVLIVGSLTNTIFKKGSTSTIRGAGLPGRLLPSSMVDSCSSKPAGRFRCGAWMWFCMAASMP